jgi:hypothetical protein
MLHRDSLQSDCALLKTREQKQQQSNRPPLLHALLTFDSSKIRLRWQAIVQICQPGSHVGAGQYTLGVEKQPEIWGSSRAT